MRIGFLFSHDQIHQIAHSLPIALDLAQRRCDIQIVLATTKPNIAREVGRLAGAHPGANVVFATLRLRRRRSKLVATLANGALPAAKLFIYGDNLDFFRSLDTLVVTEKTSLILKTRYRLDSLKIIHTRHGAGDRAIGFDRASAAFDHVLVAGPKVRDRLIAEARVKPADISIVGYPKFDLYAATTIDGPPAAGRPVVLYNPHPSPHLSSWYRMGRAILDWFVAHDEYYLIFAPHVMLFQRKWMLTLDKLRIDRPGHLAERYRRAPNILIDLGSRTSTTMAYTNRADIYLGDVSSQVYEFLLRPRPCVFVDAHRTDWRDDRNFAHWAAGPVVSDIGDLGGAIEQARARHRPHYASIQRRLFAYTFDLNDVPSSRRAADQIARLSDGDR